jgi:hypothetical protein
VPWEVIDDANRKASPGPESEACFNAVDSPATSYRSGGTHGGKD